MRLRNRRCQTTQDLAFMLQWAPSWKLSEQNPEKTQETDTIMRYGREFQCQVPLSERLKDPLPEFYNNLLDLSILCSISDQPTASSI